MDIKRRIEELAEKAADSAASARFAVAYSDSDEAYAKAAMYATTAQACANAALALAIVLQVTGEGEPG